MKKLFQFLAMAFAFTLSVAPAYAEASAKLFYGMINEGGNSKKLASITLDGYFNGYLWANAYNQNIQAPMIYCQPEGLALQLDQEVDIFVRYLNKNPGEMDTYTGIVVMKALMETFPCS
jgi:hypothetical protein